MRTFFARTGSLATLACCAASLAAAAARADDIDLLLAQRLRPPIVRLAGDESDAGNQATAAKPSSLEQDVSRVFDNYVEPVQFPDRPTVPVIPAAQVTAAPIQPVQPIQPIQPIVPIFAPAIGASSGLSSVVPLPTLGAGGPTPGADTGAVLAASTATPSVSAQHRSETSYDPVIRGYYGSQIYASGDGAYWYAARPDLDTMLSKFEPALIQNIAVIPGPYGVQYGPGLSFIDVQTAPTPRSESGQFESTFRTLGLYRFNGAQGSVREIVDGAGGDWGFRLSYGLSQGSDYKAGNGMPIPSAYDNRDVLAEFGYDLSCCTHLEVSYQHADELDTEYPGRLFNIDHMGTDALNIRLNNDDVGTQLTKWTAIGWYNRTDFRGSIDHNPNYFPGITGPQLNNPNEFWTVERIEAAVDLQEGLPIGTTRLDGTTSGNNLSTGYRFGTQLGDSDDIHFNSGTDFRYLQQNIQENYVGSNFTGGALPSDLGEFSDNLPTSYMWNPGIYGQLAMPWNSYLKTDIGARYDYVATSARLGELGPPFVTNSNLSPPLDQHDGLYAVYVTNEAKIDQCLTATLGFGHAESPPSLIERYSNGEFVGISQDGFTKLIGNPELGPERALQVDASVSADYDVWRGKAAAFYSWINDYITYTDDLVFGPTFPAARTFRFANTRLATLTGFELTGEYDLNCCLSPFAKMSYVYGVDEELHACLPDMPPLDTVFGLRWHDPAKDRKWQVEFFGRADYEQTHVGYIPSAAVGGLIPVGSPTPGFLIWNIHAFYYYNDNLKFVAGIDNLFDRTYLQALDLRLTGPQYSAAPGSPNVFPTSFVYAPGFSPYFGMEWKF